MSSVAALKRSMPHVWRLVAWAALLIALAGLSVGDAAAQSDPRRKHSAGNEAAGDRVPLPQSVPQPAKRGKVDPKSPTSEKVAAPPDVWRASEIADAKRICAQAFKEMVAIVEAVPPIKKGPCGAPAPVRLISIGKNNPVRFVPPPTIDCRMLKPLKRWIDKGLQPFAARHLEALVADVRVMSSYSCRTRYGRRGARMSEHAFANALDIGGFKLTNGERVSVLKHWGPTRRDIVKAVAVAKAAEKAAKEGKRSTRVEPLGAKLNRPVVVIPRQAPSQAQRNAQSNSRTARLPEAAPERSRVASPSRDKWSAGVVRRFAMPPLPHRRPLRRAVAAQREEGAKPSQFRAPYRLGGPSTKRSAPRAIFLRNIHRAACKIFGTTLGPEANEAHRNHFHFDMYPRRRGGYCE